jgi:D-sedoheptulose 7-phosphate isomerase
MIANDFGYDFTFSKQLLVYGEMEDMLITISCSGTSPNIVNAIIAAKILGMRIYNFETFKKGRDYGKLEDKHIKLVHQIKKLL